MKLRIDKTFATDMADGVCLVDETGSFVCEATPNEAVRLAALSDRCEALEQDDTRQALTELITAYDFGEDIRANIDAARQGLRSEEPKTPDLHCEVCGGINLQSTAWYYLNTGKFADGDPPTDGIWCDDCSFETGIKE